jgi:WD40 repeat protein
VSIFPNGNIISGSANKMINIYDNNLNIIQKINEGHSGIIFYIDIKDDNNFVSCSADKKLITWIKKKNTFVINKTISPAHTQIVRKVLYYQKDKIISCSFDKTVKIWEEKDNNYQLITKLSHSNIVWSILVLKDKNLLISCGYDGTRIWNNNNLELIQYFKSVKCRLRNGLSRMDDDTIIIGGYQIMNVISLSKNVILAQIKIPFDCYGIKIIEEKRIILVGGDSKDFVIYKSDSYEYIKTIKNAHNDNIKGFVEFKNGLIASFSEDKTIKIWSF